MQNSLFLLDICSYEDLTKRANILDRMVQIQPEITKAMTTIWGDVAKVIQSISTSRNKSNPKPPAD